MRPAQVSMKSCCVVAVREPLEENSLGDGCGLRSLNER